MSDDVVQSIIISVSAAFVFYAMRRRYGALLLKRKDENMINDELKDKIKGTRVMISLERQQTSLNELIHAIQCIRSYNCTVLLIICRDLETLQNVDDDEIKIYLKDEGINMIGKSDAFDGIIEATNMMSRQLLGSDSVNAKEDEENNVTAVTSKESFTKRCNHYYLKDQDDIELLIFVESRVSGVDVPFGQGVPPHLLGNSEMVAISDLTNRSILHSLIHYSRREKRKGR